MTQRDRIVQQALSLPPEDRAFVADQLEQSLEDDAVESPEIAAAWAEEVARRLASYDRGEVEAVDAETALENMRRLFDERRARGSH